MKAKSLEPIVVIMAVAASLALPFLPFLSKPMLSGYFVLSVAFLGCFESAAAASMCGGFCFLLASVYFAFAHKWGITAFMSMLAFFSFGLIAGVELFYHNIAIGHGLVFLLAILIIHSFLGMKWYLQSSLMKGV